MSDAHTLAYEAVHWSGFDVSKKTFDASLVRHGQKWPATALPEVPVCTFPRTLEGAKAFVQWLHTLLAASDEPFRVRVVMEATGRYSRELTEWLMALDPSLEPAIAPPQQTAAFIASMGLRNKTDRLEARALGFYGMEREPAGCCPLTAQEEELRELSRYRDFLVEEHVAASNQAQEAWSCKAVRDMQEKRLRLLEKDIQRVETQMRELVKQTPELKRDIDQMSTIYGVGFLTATTVRVELGDLRQFPKARQLSAYAGLSPSLLQSGSSIHGRPHMSKRGNSRVRQYLYLAAMTAVRGDNDLKRTYQQLLRQGKSAMSALGAIMRKLLVLMRAIVISGKPFDPMWKTRREIAQCVWEKP